MPMKGGEGRKSAATICLGAALALSLCLLTAFPAAARELSYQYRESLVRSAFIYNLAKFVTWPTTAFEDEHSPLVLTILAPTFDTSALETLAGRKVRNHPLHIRAVSRVEQIERTHILYIGENFDGAIEPILGVLKDTPVLSIGIGENFVDQGGILRLFTRAGRLRFEVDLKAAQGAGLTLSSEILRLASSVRHVEGRGE